MISASRLGNKGRLTLYSEVLPIWLFSGGFGGNPEVKRRIYEHRKQVSAIALLRGPFSDALKKKPESILTPEKPEGSERVYRIIEATTNETDL